VGECASAFTAIGIVSSHCVMRLLHLTSNMKRIPAVGLHGTAVDRDTFTVQCAASAHDRVTQIECKIILSDHNKNSFYSSHTLSTPKHLSTFTKFVPPWPPGYDP
jgi:hypothetical protein